MTMAVRIKTVGALLEGLPRGWDQMDGAGLTVAEIMDKLVAKYGEALAHDLYKDGEYRPGLAFLLNGRNVLGLSERFATRLKDGDELIIATMLAGG